MTRARDAKKKKTVFGDRMTPARLKRIRAIEELYLNGYCASEIYNLLKESFGTTYGTIRNDIVEIRKMWQSDMSHRESLEGKDRYMASIRSLRRKVMDGYSEAGQGGVSRIVGRDYKLAHQLDKEIAKLSGVTLASEEHTIHLSIQAARDYIGKIMEVVMSHVTDAEIQQAIISEIEALSDE